MAYDDEHARKSRVVVETPTSRREVTQTEAVHSDRDRGGISGATVGIIVVVAIALITIVVLFLMNGQNNDTTNANLAAQQQPAQQPPVIVQQPAQQQQPPVIIQQPAAPAAQQPPVIITQPAPSGGLASGGSDDGAIQMAIDKKIGEDPTFSSLGITATVLDGKVTLTGTVKNEGLKTQIERMIRATKGVKRVDNQIVAMG
jgi:BON domain-containing protein